MKGLNKIISENIKLELKKFINEDIVANNEFESVHNDFKSRIISYFNIEETKLVRKKNFAKNMSESLKSCNDTIMSLGYDYSDIVTNNVHGDYDIRYYISDSENWSDDEFMDAESSITSQLSQYNSYLNISVDNDNTNRVFISINFSIDDIIDLDV